MRHLGFMAPKTAPAVGPPTLALLESSSTGSSVPVSTDAFTPVAGRPLIVCQSARRGAAISPLAKAVISNSGAALGAGWATISDAVQLGSLPSAVRCTLFTALAPNPTRSLTVTSTCSDATFQHVVVLQLTDALNSFLNFIGDIGVTGDLDLTLPTVPLANSLSLLAMAIANADGPLNPPPFFANPTGYTQLYNFTKASTGASNPGINPIGMYIGYQQADAAIAVVTSGGTAAGNLLEIKRA